LSFRRTTKSKASGVLGRAETKSKALSHSQQPSHQQAVIPSCPSAKRQEFALLTTQGRAAQLSPITSLPFFLWIWGCFFLAMHSMTMQVNLL